MINFINKNKYKIVMVVFLFVLLLTLSGCRTNSEVWYTKPYLDGWKGYGAEWSFQKFKNGEFIAEVEESIENCENSSMRVLFESISCKR